MDTGSFSYLFYFKALRIIITRNKKDENRDISGNVSFSSSYKRYVLLILTGVYTFNFIDRQILVIVQESVKKDLGLSDTQLGLLTGFAFAIFYVSVGIPVARWADKGNRKNIIALALTLWSAMTAISGLIQNYLQLLLARIGVGVGEAGGSPPAHSIISDYFPEEKRATALSIYSIGIYIGVLIGYMAGGWIDQLLGWRMAFFILGIPGVLYAGVLYFTVKEPPRGYADKKGVAAELPPSWQQVFRVLFSRPTFVYLSLGCAANAFVLYGTGNWYPPFLARIYAMNSAAVGTWLALIGGIGGGIGTYLGGYVGDRWGQTDRKWYLWIPAFAILLNIPFACLQFLAGQTHWTLIAAVFTILLNTTYLAPSIAVTHGMVGLRMRAFSSAVLFFILNFIGLGLGPLYVGAMSDLLSTNFGPEALRWALVSTIPFSLVAALFYFKAAQTLELDLSRAGQ